MSLLLLVGTQIIFENHFDPFSIGAPKYQLAGGIQGLAEPIVLKQVDLPSNFRSRLALFCWCWILMLKLLSRVCSFVLCLP